MPAGGIVEIEVVPDLAKFPGRLQAGLQATTGIASAAGRAIGLAITAGTIAAAAGFTQIIKLGNDYQGKLNEIQAVSGATGDTMARVGARAKELGSDLTLSGVSAADAAGAMLELAKGGLSVDQAMEAAKGTLQLAGAAQIDGARAAEIQAQTLNQFALSAGEAGRVADTLANTANAASGGVEDIALAMKYVGPVAASMSVSLEDTATAIGLLANNGIMADTAGTSLRGMLVSLAAPSAAAKKGIAALGIEAFDSQGKFVGFRSVIEQLSTAQGRMTEEQFASAAAMAFGREPLAAITALARSGAPAFDEMRIAVGKQGGAAEVAAAKMQGLGGAMEGFKSNLETVAISIYEVIDGPLEALVRAGTTGLDVLNDALSGKGLDLGPLSGIIDSGISIFNNLRVAAEPVGRGIKAVWDSLSQGSGPVSAATSALNLLAGAVELVSRVLGPIGSVIGGVLSLFAALPGPVQTAVLALLALKTVPGILSNLTTGMERAGEAGGKTATALGKVGGALRTLTTGGVVGAFRGFNDEMRVQQALASANGESLGKLGAAHATLQARVFGATASIRDMQTAALGAGQSISTAEAAVRVFSERSPTVAAMAGSFSTVSSAAIRMGQDVGNSAREAGAAVGDRLGNAITETGNKITAFPGQVASAFGTVKTAIGLAAIDAANSIRGIPDAAREAGNTLRTAIGVGALEAGERLRNLRTAVTEAGGTLRTGLGLAAINASESMQRMGLAAIQTGDRMKEGFKSAVDSAKELPTTIANAVRGIPDATRGAFSAMGDAARNAFTSVGGAVDTGIGHLSRFVGYAAGAGAAVGTGLIRGASSLVSFLGGPWGVALAAAGVALSLWSDANAKAEQEVAAHKSKVDEIAGSFDKVTGAVTESTRAIAAKEITDTKLKDGTTSLSTALQQLGIDTRDYADAVTGNIPKQQQIAEKLNASTRAAIEASPAFQNNIDTLQRWGVSLDDVTAAVNGNVPARERLIETAKRMGAGDLETTQANQMLVNSLLGLGGASAEVSAQFGAAIGTFAEGAEQFKTNAQITQNWTDALSALKNLRVFEAIAAGNPVTREMAAGMSAAARSAEELAISTGNTVKGTSGLEQGAVAARDKMAGLRNEFVQSAIQAGLSETAANDLANSYGLIPGAVETIIRSNATGVQAEMITLAAQINAVPAGKDVKVNSLTEEAKQKLVDLGFTVEQLPDGTFVIRGNDDDARAKLAGILGDTNAAIGIMKIDADNTPADGKTTASVTFANGSTGTITLDGNQAPIDAKIGNSKYKIDSTTGIMTIDGNPAPGEADLSGLKLVVDRTTGTITILGKDGGVQSLKDALSKPSSSTHTINVIERRVAIGSGAGGSAYAKGAIVSPMAAGGVLGNQKLRHMRGGVADIVPPNSWRIIGDRMVGDEAYIPLVKTARSRHILAEAARRLGYSLAPVRAFHDGGIAKRVARVASSTSSVTRVDTSGIEALIARIASQVGRDIVVNMVAHNPVAEPGSATLTRNLRTLSQMGAFG